jgi:hypothetical protein
VGALALSLAIGVACAFLAGCGEMRVREVTEIDGNLVTLDRHMTLGEQRVEGIAELALVTAGWYVISRGGR